jgi:hypothetical protein
MQGNTTQETRLDSRDLEDEIVEFEELKTEAGWLAADNRCRLSELRKLRAELEGYGWEDGIQLIREDDFEEYAQELAEDCGMIPADLSWPVCYIDWERAARELSMDYSLVTFDGSDWYWREA